jgi:hypothetical protein
MLEHLKPTPLVRGEALKSPLIRTLWGLKGELEGIAAKESELQGTKFNAAKEPVT